MNKIKALTHKVVMELDPLLKDYKKELEEAQN